MLTGFTSIGLDTEIADKGLLKEMPIYEKTLNRKYKVDNIEYDLSLERNDAKSISIEIETGNESTALVKVEPYIDGKFLVTLPNGEEQIYSYTNGVVSKNLSSSSDGFNSLSPNLISSSDIVIDSVTIAALICGALIIIIMLFDDAYGLRASLRIFFQFAIAYLFIFLSGESLL